MADTTENNFAEELSQDPLAVVKRDLEGWREVLLPLNRLINWDKPFYPAIIVGVTTFIFLIIWYFEPSVLTTFSLLGLIISLIDFLVPLLGPRVLGTDKWTGEQERQYEQVCIRILNFRYHMHDLKDTMATLKAEKPKVYFILVMGFLFLFAWVGSKVNNLLLTYIILYIALVCSANPYWFVGTLNIFLLMPGLRRHSVVQGYLNKIGAIFKKTVLGKSKSK